mmetsp:Transcript_30268/g.86845  ORF Transcript_30268/g.86845 Transcript_30268/m.86845 type:complete len:202 (+) Transcript_30268:240-845(+)
MPAPALARNHLGASSSEACTSGAQAGEQQRSLLRGAPTSPLTAGLGHWAQPGEGARLAGGGRLGLAQRHSAVQCRRVHEPRPGRQALRSIRAWHPPGCHRAPRAGCCCQPRRRAGPCCGQSTRCASWSGPPRARPRTWVRGGLYGPLVARHGSGEICQVVHADMDGVAVPGIPDPKVRFLEVVDGVLLTGEEPEVVGAVLA